MTERWTDLFIGTWAKPSGLFVAATSQKTCAAQRRWSTSRSLLVSGAGWHAKEGVAPMPLLPKSRVLLELLSLGGWLLCWTGREHLQLAGALPTRRKGRDKGPSLFLLLLSLTLLCLWRETWGVFIGYDENYSPIILIKIFEYQINSFILSCWP